MTTRLFVCTTENIGRWRPTVLFYLNAL